MQTEMKVFTPEDAAAALRCTPRTVYKYLRKGLMPGRKIGGRWRILEEDLKGYLRGDPQNTEG